VLQHTLKVHHHTTCRAGLCQGTYCGLRQHTRLMRPAQDPGLAVLASSTLYVLPVVAVLFALQAKVQALW
jgi:hypothetical protein